MFFDDEQTPAPAGDEPAKPEEGAADGDANEGESADNN